MRHWTAVAGGATGAYVIGPVAVHHRDAMLRHTTSHAIRAAPQTAGAGAVGTLTTHPGGSPAGIIAGCPSSASCPSPSGNETSVGFVQPPPSRQVPGLPPAVPGHGNAAAELVCRVRRRREAGRRVLVFVGRRRFAYGAARKRLAPSPALADGEGQRRKPLRASTAHNRTTT